MGVTPRGFYEAYPDSDLLLIEPPAEDCSREDFLEAVDEGVGDGLFRFLAHELFDDDDVGTAELLQRVVKAAEDINAISVWLVKDLYKEEHCTQPHPSSP